MEHRPPLPICAEGGGGTQLRGSRDHSLAQGLRHTPLAELPARPPLYPQMLRERKEGGEKG